MGCMECATRNCDSILCRTVLSGGYICDGCQGELKEFLRAETDGEPVTKQRFDALVDTFRDRGRGQWMLRPAEEWLRAEGVHG